MSETSLFTPIKGNNKFLILSLVSFALFASIFALFFAVNSPVKFYSILFLGIGSGAIFGYLMFPQRLRFYNDFFWIQLDTVLYGAKLPYSSIERVEEIVIRKENMTERQKRLAEKHFAIVFHLKGKKRFAFVPRYLKHLSTGQDIISWLKTKIET